MALSGSVVFRCGDGTICDLVGLRGTYRIIDKTEEAIRRMLHQLDLLKIENSCIYLDAPVLNSDRLSSLIVECADEYNVSVSTQVINDVDRVLEKSDGVISGDAIILNNCISWLNIMPTIIEDIKSAWVVQLQ